MIRLIIGISGASGVRYGIHLLKHLSELGIEKFVVVSNSAYKIMNVELEDGANNIKKFSDKIYKNDDLEAPISSGSFNTDGMVVIPSSMKTVASIANGITNTLISRAADVCIKENRDLVLVPREAPINQIHLENMLSIVKSGGIIFPASPAFYNNPESIEDMLDFVVGRVLDQLDINHSIFKRWGEE